MSKAKAFVLLSLSLSFTFTGLWLIYKNYITPFMGNAAHILADPLGVPSFVFGSAFGFFTFLPLPNAFCRILGKREITIKTMAIVLVICGVLGVMANALVYKFVINSNGYIECPKKIGYKKNLLRCDYVIDASQCEKF